MCSTKEESEHKVGYLLLTGMKKQIKEMTEVYQL
jgi:hypothetical protein